MRDDGSRNIDVPSKVKAFRQDFSPAEAAIRTSYKTLTIADVLAVEGHAVVVRLSDDKLLSDAFAVRGLRPPVPGAKGMAKRGEQADPRDIEQAQTGAVGRALFLMGYGEKPDDSADYEEPAPDPEQKYRDLGWRSSEHHDSVKADAKLAVQELTEPYKTQAIKEWHNRGLGWPMAFWDCQAWTKFLVPLGRKAAEDKAKAQAAKDSGAGDAGGETESEPAPVSTDKPEQPPLEDAIGPDAPLVKR